MFKITPPSCGNVVNSNITTPPHYGRRALCVLVALFFVCLIVALGYRNGVKSLQPKAVEISRSFFYNADTIAYYTDKARTSDDPKALFVAGMASHLRYTDPDYPKDIPTVQPTEGDFYLIRAAELGNEDAMTYIKCLDAHGCWNHFVPEVKK